ncbi:glutathione synthetase [Streptomyces xanthochromogenes]|uniref:glutathione synthetase n=1 Tax=Streptomyces xanthochromogenes TaxID=67384 RepID=UPI003795994A
MALAVSAITATPPAHASGTAAIVAPTDAGDLYRPALAKYGWNCVVVTSTHTPALTGPYLRLIRHRGDLEDTSRQLHDLGVQAVIAGSHDGTELADLLADRLRLPCNTPEFAAIRRDIAFTNAALRDAGITAPRSIRTTSLPDALAWASHNHVNELVLQHPDPAAPEPSHHCHSADDIRLAWHHLSRPGTQPLVLREHFAGTRYRVHTLSGQGPDGAVEHTITSMWSEVHTLHHQVCREDLCSSRGLIARALTMFTTRVLNALGVRYGHARAMISFVPDSGPALLSLRTDPSAGDVIGDAPQAAVPDDPIRDTAQLVATGHRHTAPAPRRTQVAKIALLPRGDGALDETLLRTITALPTVVATTSLEAGMRVHAGRIAGWLLLVAGDRRAINQDHQAVRAAENHGLYGRSA